MLHWKSSSNERVWRAKQLIFAVCLQTVCRVKHWILPGYGRVIFIYTYIYILLPGHGRKGYWIAAYIVILDDTILYCIFVSLVAHHCNRVMHVWQSWAKLLTISQISRSAWFWLSGLHFHSSLEIEIKCTWNIRNPAFAQLGRATRWRMSVINTSGCSFGITSDFLYGAWGVSDSIS